MPASAKLLDATCHAVQAKAAFDRRRVEAATVIHDDDSQGVVL
jgi:hypothetical protein